MPNLIFDFHVPDTRTTADKMYDVLMELDFLLERMQELKNEATEVWEELDE